MIFYRVNYGTGPNIVLFSIIILSIVTPTALIFLSLKNAVLFYLLFSPFYAVLLMKKAQYRITIDEKGIYEKGFWSHRFVTWDSKPYVSMIHMGKYGRKEIKEEAADGFFVYAGIYISVKSSLTGKNKKKWTLKSEEILFEFRPEAWKYLREVYPPGSDYKKR